MLDEFERRSQPVAPPILHLPSPTEIFTEFESRTGTTVTDVKDC